MLVFSSALRMWSLGPKGWPRQKPAYRSRIGPAFSANCGSRGKIRYSYCQGLRASVGRMRQTVLRLMGLPRAAWARVVRSASDWRLKGLSVCATTSQAMDLTTAWSRGGKAALAAPAGFVVKGEVAGGAGPPPGAYGVRVETDQPARLDVGQGRPFLQAEHQRGPLA